MSIVWQVWPSKDSASSPSNSSMRSIPSCVATAMVILSVCSSIDAVNCRAGAPASGQYSLPVKWRSLLSLWRASIRRTVPERERMTRESVTAPSLT